MKKLLFILSFFLFQGLSFAQWNTDKLMSIGQNALYFEDFVLSIQYFNKVISVKPYLSEPYMYRAMAKIQLGDYKGAEEDADNAILRNPFVPQAYYVRGFIRRSLKHYQEALDDFTKAFEFSPNSSFILINRMDVSANLENYEAALDDLTEYMRQNPKTNELLYEKGQLQMALKDSVAAEKTFNDFVAKDKRNFRSWNTRALFYLQRDDLDKALSDYDKAIELKSNFVGDYINRGIILNRKNRFMEALKDYDTAIKIDNANSLAFYNRALLRAALGDSNNALEDLKVVLSLEPDHYEAVFRKAMIEDELRNYTEALRDYKLIIEKYPHFSPAHFAMAEIEKKRGNLTASGRYYQRALDIEEEIKKKKEDKPKRELTGENKIADKERLIDVTGRRAQMFNRFAAQNMNRAEKESKYSSQLRGNIQDRYIDLVSERNFVLTLYAKTEELRRTNIYHTLLKQYNKDRKEAPIKITNQEISLTQDLADLHFEMINRISEKLTEETKDANLFFDRAMQFALLQDFSSAINDLNKAILLHPDFVLAYFFRANLRYKQVQYDAEGEVEEPSLKIDKNEIKKEYSFDSEMIMRDFDKVISLAPDFQFAYFNKANVLVSLQDFRGAITYYSKAIEIDPGFSEAYYNRGLTYLLLSEDDKGLADLSKAGELGIYKVYNLIQRFTK